MSSPVSYPVPPPVQAPLPPRRRRSFAGPVVLIILGIVACLLRSDVPVPCQCGTLHHAERTQVMLIAV